MGVVSEGVAAVRLHVIIHHLSTVLSLGRFLLDFGLVGLLQTANAQNNNAPKAETSTPAEAVNQRANLLTTETVSQTPPTLVIAPGEELEITVYGVPDLSEHTRVGPGGSISMPLIGSVRIAVSQVAKLK